MGYKETFGKWQKLKEKAVIGGGQVSVEKQHEMGMMTARERIDLLVDKDTFVEVNMLGETQCKDFGMDARKIPGDGVITGIGEIDGRKIASNMLSDAESDINLKEQVGVSSRTVQLKPVKEKREISFEIPIILIILALIIFELIFIKIRGDI